MLSTPRETTTPSCLLCFLVFAFLTANLLYLFGGIPLRIPFVWSAQSSTKFETILQPFEIKNASCNIPRLPSYSLEPPEQSNIPVQIEEYLAFHAETRACLLNDSCKPFPKILIAKCSRYKGCAGLGDRLRGLLFSFTIALITKRVLFLDHLSEPFPLTSGLAPYAVDWTLPSTVPYNHSWPHLEWNWCAEGRVCEGNAPALTDFENFDAKGPGINMLTDDIEKVFGDRPVVTVTSRSRYYRLKFIHENPYLKDRYGDLAKYLLENKLNFYRLMFQPALPTRQLMKSVEFMNDYISVHIRTGVDTKEDKSERFAYWSTHEEETAESTFRCIERIAKNTTNIFLASDSPNTKKIFMRKAEEKGYIVHMFKEKTVHSDQIRNKIGKKPWDDLCAGYLTVLADLFMLSRGKILVKNGSHFSTLAWFLSKSQMAYELKPGQKCKYAKRPS